MKKLFALVFLTFCLLTTFSCQKSDVVKSEEEALPIQLTKSESVFLDAGNDLAFRFFHSINSGKSFIVSPLSLQRTLGMLQNGAVGQTKDEIINVLGYSDNNMAQVNTYLKSLEDQLLQLDKSATLYLADAMFITRKLSLEPAFIEQVTNNYKARVSSLDFMQERESLEAVNNWISSETDGMIPSVMSRVDPLTVCILLNAMTFKNAWSMAFDSKQTASASFRDLEGKTLAVPLMYKNDVVKYASDSDFEFIRLPYGNGGFEMAILLPKRAESLSTISYRKWQSLFTSSRERQMDIFLPKFKLEYSQVLDDVLSHMGMPLSFEPNKADFSKISETGGLHLEDVRQCCYLEVDEQGSKAAAATVAPVVGYVSSGRVTDSVPMFRADHTFAFAIVEKSTGSILLMGCFDGE